VTEEGHRRRDEKEEKEEKEEKPRRERRTREEKWAGDPLSPLIWGSIIIWIGLVLTGVTLATLPWLHWENAWSLILVGAGFILLVEVLIRVAMPTYRRPVRGRLTLAFILLIIGVGGFIGWELTWPLILVAIGLSIIIGALLRPRF
jgi:hypothetical protein